MTDLLGPILCTPVGGRGPRGDQRWATFLRNHARGIVACDFCVAVTATFRILYVFVLMEHASRRLIHINATAHPTAAWTLQQLREAIPSDHAYRFIIHDHDAIFSAALDAGLDSLGITVITTPMRRPQANALCERLIGTLRRECLDWIIPLNERHLQTIVTSWMAHYNHGRPHSALGPGLPEQGSEESPVRVGRPYPPPAYKVVGQTDLGWTPSRIPLAASCRVSKAVEKIPWQGLVLAVQPRIRLTRSFDQRSHTYLGYALLIRGSVGQETREFLLGVGQGTHAKHRFQLGNVLSGDALPVPDPRLETVEFYQVTGLKVAPPQTLQAPPPPMARGGAAARSLSPTRTSASCRANLCGEMHELHPGLPDAGRDDH